MMKTLITGLILTFLIGCQDNKKPSENNLTEFNQELKDELIKMAEIDQVAASYPQGRYKEYSQERWMSFKDSVYSTHQNRIEEIFDKYGFAGYDLVGKDGSRSFWLMVQHSDHKPDFQERVLSDLKKEVEKENANPSMYGLLVDRVRINNGKEQVYGSQVAYDTKKAQAYPKMLEDSINVNKRRASLGLEPIEEYLNSMARMHYEMNKDIYLEKGIKEPYLYNIEK
ncbi:DUF6624 domain-containing protein [Christiangramia echinicola]|nr:DUF6624 domain-containing protein [Christiangramia echinicola]